MLSKNAWSVALMLGCVWTLANLIVYGLRTRRARRLGWIGSLSIWAWGLYVALTIVVGAIQRPFGLDLPILGRVVALMLALAGGALALRGMREFRSLARISALDETRLVTSGIYARVRHPQVAGLLLVAFGLSLAAGTLVGICGSVVVLVWSLLQTRLEDRRLIVMFGDEARRYIASVPAYRPRIPRTRALDARS